MKETLVQHSFLVKLESLACKNQGNIKEDLKIDNQEWENSAEEALNGLLKREIIREHEDGTLSFAGDDFDHLYTKYHVRSRGLTVRGIGEQPYEWIDAVGMRLGTIIVDSLPVYPRSTIYRMEGFLSDTSLLVKGGSIVMCDCQ